MMTKRNGEPDRVRAHTARRVNAEIDGETAHRIRYYAPQDKQDLTRRIEDLELEWDIDRHLEFNAATFGLSGLILGMIHDRRWLIVPGIVLGFLLQHAAQGWCPPVSLFRRLGVRTRREIEAEKYALKALRGDFEDLYYEKGDDVFDSSNRVIEAVRK